MKTPSWVWIYSPVTASLSLDLAMTFVFGSMCHPTDGSEIMPSPVEVGSEYPP